jgi:hypothetical protein
VFTPHVGVLVEPLALTSNGAQPVFGDSVNAAVGVGLTQIVLVMVSLPQVSLFAKIILML